MNKERIEKITITDELTLSLLNLKKIHSCHTCVVPTHNKRKSKWVCDLYPGMGDMMACGEYKQKNKDK